MLLLLCPEGSLPFVSWGLSQLRISGGQLGGLNSRRDGLLSFCCYFPRNLSQERSGARCGEGFLACACTFLCPVYHGSMTRGGNGHKRGVGLMDRAVLVPKTNVIAFHVFHGAATRVPCDIGLMICFL